MSTPVKLIVGIGSLSIVAGGAYFLNQHLSKETIEQKLKKNKYEIFQDYSNQEWTKIFEQYQLVSAEAGNKFKFKGTTITTKEKLQNQCKTVLAKTDTAEDIYNTAEKWCTVPKTLKEVLKNKGYVALSTADGKDDLNQSEWNAKIKLHNKKEENKNKRFTNLNGSNDEAVTENSDGRNKIRKACKDLEEKKHYEKDFEANLDKSVFWCTETKSESN